MPKCQVCQKDNPSGVEYCEDCGAALAPAAPQSAGRQEPRTATPTQAGPALAAGPAGAQTATQQARLIAKRYGVPTGEEIPLLGDRLVVGRFDPETGPVDIDLSSVPESAHVSRRHGELYLAPDGQWYLKDLGSTNGVFVKANGDASFGPRLTVPRSLSNGDEVAFGNARFIFCTE